MPQAAYRRIPTVALSGDRNDVPSQASARSRRREKLALALLQRARQFDVVLFEAGDAAVQFGDVGGGAEAGSPGPRRSSRLSGFVTIT